MRVKSIEASGIVSVWANFREQRGSSSKFSVGHEVQTETFANNIYFRFTQTHFCFRLFLGQSRACKGTFHLLARSDLGNAQRMMKDFE